MYVFDSGLHKRRVRGWMRGLCLGFNNTVRTRRVLDVSLCCGGVGEEWVGGLEQLLEEWSGLMSVSLDSLYRWQVQIFVYCSRQIVHDVHPHRYVSAYNFQYM